MAIKFNRTAILVGALFSTIALSLPAVAGDGSFGTGGYSRELHKMEMMKMLDGNGDHMVSHDEFTQYYTSIFEALDTDHDGSVDAKEWVGTKGDQKISLATGGYSAQLRTMAMMKLMDTDGTHKVTKEQFLKFHDGLFSAMDKTADGNIDPQEWLAKITGNK